MPTWLIIVILALIVLAVPAAVGGGRGDEVALDLREVALERGTRALELLRAGEDAARGEQDQNDDDDDQPGGHEMRG